MAIIAEFKNNSKKTYAGSAHQYDRGQKLIIRGITLPDNYEVHVSNQKEEGFASPVKVDPEGIFIPDAFFMSGDYIYIWIYVIESKIAPSYQIDPENHTTTQLPDDETERSGTTIYEIVVPVIRRPIQLSFDYGRGDSIVGYIVDDDHRLIPVRK